MIKCELVSPAGDLEKLKVAVDYGADGVYIGAKQYSLRTASGNFSIEDMQRGIEYAKAKGRKVYLALNIVAHNSDIEGIAEIAAIAYDCGIDAAIVSDLGAFSAAQQSAPKLPLHISTQASTSNYMSANMWHKLGAKRIVLAREMPHTEITELRQKTDSSLELEVFVHGAMCMSYSGRCMLSSYMASRDSNKGACAHPCRWKYYLMEEKRPGEYMPIYEDEKGSYIFNSKDLCLVAHIPQMLACGISALKIEGRVKSEYYVATVTKAYRQAIDAALQNPATYEYAKYFAELTKVSHRSYSTGFFLGEGGEQIYDSNSYMRDYAVMGVVRDYVNGEIIAEQRGKMELGDTIEIMQPHGDNITFELTSMTDAKGNAINATPHAAMLFKIPHGAPIQVGSYLRKQVDIKLTDNR